MRYDVNDGQDSAGNPISDDSRISPRLGMTYDIFGNGRLRANATYSTYVSRIQEGIGGAGGGGNYSTFQYEYDGPQIGGRGSGLGSFDVLEQVFQWFLSPAIGGTSNTSNLISVNVPGLNTRFDGTLKSPFVNEMTLGLASRIGANGHVRFDFIDRQWGDFYSVTTRPNDQVENPYVDDEFLDFRTTTNTDDVERTYQALQGQFAYRFFNRVNLGASYTYSEARGNEVGENAGSGPVADASDLYVEYKSFARNNPVGFLPTDQKHRARIWASYDQPLGGFGNLNVSVLERFDSGIAYSASGNVHVGSFVANPGYATPPASALYFFSDRGEYRGDNITATDLALNWSMPLSRAQLFVQGEIINLFNEQAVTLPSTSITVFGANRFNPFTETPRECPEGTASDACIAGGYNWRKNASFGEATSPASYQLPFTYRASVGIRF